MNGMKLRAVFLPLTAIILLIMVGCNANAQFEPAALLNSIDSAVGSAIEDATASMPVLPAVSPRHVAAQDGTLTGIYNEVNPSVVHIQVVKTETGLPFLHPETANPDGSPSPDGPAPDGPAPDDPSPNEQPAPDEQLPPEGLAPDNPLFNMPPQAFGEGSGFVWDKDGHIVTNNHVIDGAEKITVVFADDTDVEATLIGADPDSDLAVLKVETSAGQLLPVHMGDSSNLQVGELAIAIGNPFGQEGTMTVGIISALGRLLAVDAGNPFAPRFNIPDIIQTDAAINPGNSGGVLLNDQGEVIGVTTAIISASRTSAGIGFAVPAAIVNQVVPALITNGHYDHPFLGISGGSMDSDLAEAMDLPADQRGVLVAEVVPDGPAAEAGLEGNDRQVEIEGIQVDIGGDVITAFDGEPIKSMDELITYLERHTQVGQQVELSILRDGELETVSATLSARPKREAEPFAIMPDDEVHDNLEDAEEDSEESPSEESPSEEDPHELEERAWLGILGAPVTPETAAAMDLAADQAGVLIQQVEPGSPADTAGLVGSSTPVDVNGTEVLIGGDVIVAVEGTDVSGPLELVNILSEYESGDEITLDIIRDSEEISVMVTLGERSNK